MQVKYNHRSGRVLNEELYTQRIQKLPLSASITYLAKEVMFFVVLVCLSVNNITHKASNGFNEILWRGSGW